MSRALVAMLCILGPNSRVREQQVVYRKEQHSRHRCRHYSSDVMDGRRRGKTAQPDGTQIAVARPPSEAGAAFPSDAEKRQALR